MISRILATTLLSFILIQSYAQFPGAGNGGGQNMNLGHFYGKIIDAAGNKPVDGASIQLFQSKMDSVTKKRKDVLIAGMLTTKKGEFSLENLPVLSTFKLKITAIGYKDTIQKVFFDVDMGAAKSGDYSSMINGVDKDLGNIALQTNAVELQGVVVTAEKPLFSMALDRKVFNVEKNLTSVGGSAQDVMKNVPGLNVDINGNVTMRNLPPQIFVDGRPTTMTLDEIPSDDIESVEIITNPSAKFDASGGGAGIVNIVLKKNRKPGYNGTVRASIDSRGKPSVGGTINIKQQKVNIFASGALNYRKSISTVRTGRTGFLGPDSTAYLKQNDGPVNSGYFAFGRLGIDYLIDNRNTITLSGNIVRGHFSSNDVYNISEDTVSNSGDINNVGNRYTNTQANFRNYAGLLSFKHNYAKPNKNLTADFNYSYSKNDNENNFNSQIAPAYLQQVNGGGNTGYFTAQTDYVNPITKTIKIEMGARAAIRNFTSFTNTFDQGYLNIGPADSLINSLSNNYNYQDKVYAAYATFSQELKKFSYQVGLRAESSNYSGTLYDTTSSTPVNNKYPLSLFPSVYLTYKLTDKQDIQLNGSRKVNRPSFFQLIPIINYSDPLNLTTGNPNLVPEFTNLFELSYQNQIDNGNTFIASLYYRNTNNLISTYTYQTKNPHPTGSVNDSVVFITSYANANRSYTTGLELTSSNKINSWWDITTNINLYNSTIDAGNLAGDANNNESSWFGKLNNNFKLPKKFTIQLSGFYSAKSLLPQSSGGNGMARGGAFGQQQPSANGYINPSGSVDIAIKKDFLKNNAASLTLQIADIFRTRTYSTVQSVNNESGTLLYTQNNWSIRDPQVIRLNFNWRFGKTDISLFKRKDMKSEMENMQNINSSQQ
jgi:outer membrane receptor protein involved in Fe transport